MSCAAPCSLPRPMSHQLWWLRIFPDNQCSPLKLWSACCSKQPALHSQRVLLCNSSSIYAEVRRKTTVPSSQKSREANKIRFPNQFLSNYESKREDRFLGELFIACASVSYNPHDCPNAKGNWSQSISAQKRKQQDIHRGIFSTLTYRCNGKSRGLHGE